MHGETCATGLGARERDHARLRSLLGAAASDAEAYLGFREGLLRHIGMEEKILLPAAALAAGGVPLPVARLLRADHSAIAAMLVPPPTPALLRRLAALLTVHDALEEGPAARHFDDARVHDRIAALESAALAARRT